MSTVEKIRPKHRDAILQSLRAGVVPRVGQQYIQVGRAEELKALIGDIERIADGGSGVRFVIGEFGSGKTFFLHLVRSVALEKQLVTAHADLSPERRIYATGGQARSLYSELMRNLATRTKPDGGALPSIVERFVTAALTESKERNLGVEIVLRERLSALQEMVGGFDFAEVIAAYWRAHESGNEALKSAAIRWMRGEYSTKTEAKAALGVRTIVDDSNVYDQLKLFSRFVRLAGYGGLLVGLDEMVNLYKLANTQARTSNYEQILRVFNDCLQGSAVGLAFLFGGTPEFLLDPRRGLYSYQALQSRLSENTFAANGLVDLSGPVIRLPNLTPEDLFVLLGKLRHVYASGDPAAYLVPDDALTAFMTHCSEKIGDAYFRTPRQTIRTFIDLLAVIEQNPTADWKTLLSAIEIPTDENPDLEPLPTDEDEPPTVQSLVEKKRTEGDDELSTFRL